MGRIKHRWNELRAAAEEVQTKSSAEIDRDTARKWADRAIASYGLYGQTGELDRLLAAEDHKHEALEHAAQVGDRGKFVGEIEREIGEAARAARGSR